MSWAAHAKSLLREGKTATVKPRGNSMRPIIFDGDTVTLDPIKDPDTLRKGTVVLCRVNGRDYLHLIKAIKHPGPRFQIANRKGRVNGWVGTNSIFGIVADVER